jgi:hypothetical protein
MRTHGTPNIEILDPWGTPSFLIPLFFQNLPPTFPSYSLLAILILTIVMESESESVRSSDEEVTFALLRFPVVNVKPLLRSRSYPVTSHYRE